MNEWAVLAIVLGPTLLVGAVFGAHHYGWRGLVTMPLQLVGGLAAFAAVGLFLHYLIY